MRVIVACEFSGVVRDAFRARGHDAVSCDLLPSERPGPHIQGDVFQVLDSDPRWDLMVFFWPCTNMAVSGARWFHLKREEQARDVEAFRRLATWPTITRIAGENPVGVLSTRYRKPDQIIQPWMFGHPESKSTCLWLKGLPLLTATKVLEPEWAVTPDGDDYRDGALLHKSSHAATSGTAANSVPKVAAIPNS